MLLRLLHSFASTSPVYNGIQWLAGATTVRRRFQRHTGVCAGHKTVLDVGGGTGAMRAYLPPDCHYICLDVETPKLRGFRRAHPSGSALLADATRMPIPSNSVDVVLCVAMSHHLDDSQFDSLLKEAQRVVKKGGLFLFLDAELAPHRLAARLLWYLDRGSHPRTRDTMERVIGEHFNVLERELFSIYHTYLLIAAERR
jgi:ubiquinone/menaquinone biosynthesis C-methylase UbiE